MPFFGVPIRNGLPIGLGSVAGFGAPQEFTPAELFIGGTAGTWYDPSDLTTMFTTSAGTTPVAMPGQGLPAADSAVGLMLDKSQGLALGPELVTATPVNGTLYAFSTFTTSGVLITSAIKTPTDFAGASWDLGNDLPVGTIYEATITIAINSGPAPKLIVGTTNNGSPTLRSNIASLVNGQNTVKLIITGASARYLTVGTESAAYNFSVTSISLKRILGNHAIAINDSTARPELRARVNLLTYSEEFQNAAWARVGIAPFGSGSVANTTATTDPLGGNTADFLLPTGGIANRQRVSQTATVASGSQTLQSCYIKPFGYTKVALRENNTSGYYVSFDLASTSSPSILASSNATGTVVHIGNGWFLCTMTTSIVGTSFGAGVYVLSPTYTTGDPETPTWTPNGTDGIFAWGADLRPANIGAAVPAYQRIADANTYDTAGFPLYLRFDGIDDGMYTPANLNLSATDKVGVFAGVRKLSDAAVGMFAEFSPSLASAGTFNLAAPSANVSLGANFGPAVRGNGSIYGEDSGSNAAPITAVLASAYDLAAADKINFRINGAAASVVNNGNNAGTGNFGSYQFYVGSRGNSTFWFQGHLHGLIVVGRAVSAGNISATESWMAGKTGLVLP